MIIKYKISQNISSETDIFFIWNKASGVNLIITELNWYLQYQN